ncbi:hypothetical protein HK099_001013 [Clydaea vesicula]|uniref:C2H2-type domain-containing protein n=1 Tax=Clydaea vesicula TaxID=447962 RepID=A0AAD5TX67_9FUNG|nr:hypothetical protein HK099_001013 [Clydaea vesicula]KAJ3395418.1 hypothetical protein HDU92_005808 [Lobulomyces angularis]
MFNKSLSVEEFLNMENTTKSLTNFNSTQQQLNLHSTQSNNNSNVTIISPFFTKAQPIQMKSCSKYNTSPSFSTLSSSLESTTSYFSTSSLISPPYSPGPTELLLSQKNLNNRFNLAEDLFDTDIDEDVLEFDLIFKNGLNIARCDSVSSQISLDSLPDIIVPSTPPNLSNNCSKEDSLKCLLCNYTFQRKHDLKRHHRTKHLNIRPHKCEHCNKGFGRRDALERHTDVPAPYKCKALYDGRKRRKNS